VVFGKVIDGMLTLRKIENVPTGPNNRPKLVVKITGLSSHMFFLEFILINLFRVWGDVTQLNLNEKNLSRANTVTSRNVRFGPQFLRRCYQRYLPLQESYAASPTILKPHHRYIQFSH
jgi:hypothetical protein